MRRYTARPWLLLLGVKVPLSVSAMPLSEPPQTVSAPGGIFEGVACRGVVAELGVGISLDEGPLGAEGYVFELGSGWCRARGGTGSGTSDRTTSAAALLSDVASASLFVALRGLGGSNETLAPPLHVSLPERTSNTPSHPGPSDSLIFEDKRFESCCSSVSNRFSPVFTRKSSSTARSARSTQSSKVASLLPREPRSLPAACTTRSQSSCTSRASNASGGIALKCDATASIITGIDAKAFSLSNSNAGIKS
mmetsp:Transcript_30628/g.81488  ORF Transcript_30628/g.81488 Transcript_30628/m.81488 type:complete len:251 (+) Transcript_30628:651-1403(+)